MGIDGWRVAGRPALCLALGFVLLWPTGAGAQVGPPGGVRGANVPDTLPVDSTLLRLRERLKLLERGPGSDSARAQARADSAALRAEGAAGGLTGMRAVAPPTDDSDLFSQLLSLEGYAPTQFGGTSAEYLAEEGKLFLYGDSSKLATIRRDGEELRAEERIEYTEETRDLVARGNPVLVPAQGDEVQAEILRYNLDNEVGSARDARSQWTEGARWIVTGDLPEIRPELAYGHKTRFTSCELDEPHYHFETDQLKIVRGSVLVARPVRLYFGDVPVAWLPFIAQSLSSGRSSGLLTPTFSVNDIVRTSGGYRRRVSNVGFYWAINDYVDATMAVDWFADTFTALTGTMRYAWAKRFLQGSLDLRQFWRAEGGTELTLNTAHSWEISERMNFRARAAYASSTNLVRQNSFNPLEVTQSIDSEGGLSRRFDWGNLSVNGNRRQFLSDDRVVTTFPSLNLSMKTLTLLPAPANRAKWFNNLTLGGSGGLRRTTTDLAADQVDTGDLSGNASASLNLGNLAISGSATYAEKQQFGVRSAPDTLAGILFAPGRVAELGARAFHDPRVRQQLVDGVTVRDLAQADVTWSTTIDYQQNLVGSTTFSPRISLSGQRRQNDTLDVATSFVAGPRRLSFGAQLRGDMYGFFPGFAGYERLRHKISPSVSYDYSPEVTPTPLQVQVFGSSVQQPRNVIVFGLNQTFEAKRRARDDAAAGDGAEAGADSLAAPAPEPQGTVDENGFRRPPRDEIITLLALRTSSITYDFVADSMGRFVDGIQTTQLTNNITSDFLRGLAINMAHDLFELGSDPATGQQTKRFAPHLQSLNFSFALNNNSALFRWLGLSGGGDGAGQPDAAGRDPLDGGSADPFASDPLDAMGFSTEPPRNDESIVPGGGPDGLRRGAMGSGRVGDWSANFSYALNRPRSGVGVSQMLQMDVRLQPTESWQMSWRTGVDLETSQFADHTIRLTRDLHRWQANFDFLQTATGNWSFRFEVRLTDNEELRFDYQQRSLDRRAPTGFDR